MYRSLDALFLISDEEVDKALICLNNRLIQVQYLGDELNELEKLGIRLLARNNLIPKVDTDL